MARYFEQLSAGQLSNARQGALWPFGKCLTFYT